MGLGCDSTPFACTRGMVIYGCIKTWQASVVVGRPRACAAPFANIGILFFCEETSFGMNVDSGGE